ncbi:MAG: hypothetical protein LBU34_03870 [Planctomycetaceae bacterium]|nr:hypothetical protein [Planctomycetaceae bacterium]
MHITPLAGLRFRLPCGNKNLSASADAIMGESPSASGCLPCDCRIFRLFLCLGRKSKGRQPLGESPSPNGRLPIGNQNNQHCIKFLVG